MKNLTDFRKTVEPVWICACQWFWSKARGHGIAVLSLEDFQGTFFLYRSFQETFFFDNNICGMNCEKFNLLKLQISKQKNSFYHRRVDGVQPLSSSVELQKFLDNIRPFEQLFYRKTSLGAPVLSGRSQRSYREVSTST